MAVTVAFQRYLCARGPRDQRQFEFTVTRRICCKRANMGTALLTDSRSSEAGRRRHRILVCVDGSVFSEVCLPYAAAFAKTFGSAVSLVHVMQPHGEHGGTQASDALGWELSRQEAQAYLDRLEEKISQTSGLRVETRLEQGPPAERIVDLGRELAADLTIIGSRGGGAAPTWSLGSTAQRVLAMARGSVFIAHSSSKTPTFTTPTRILVPLDGSLRTESVLPTIARIAQFSGAEILLAHVVQEPLPTALLSVAEDMALARKLAARLTSRAAEYLGSLQKQLQQAYETGSVKTVVARHANECQCLLEIALREKIDLVVLSAHGAACDAAQSFGSVTTFLLTHSVVPVLVLQDLPGHDLHRAQENEREMARPFLRTSYAAETP
jgi:nucleotide-binding universal stress UspA family protein